ERSLHSVQSTWAFHSVRILGTGNLLCQRQPTADSPSPAGRLYNRVGRNPPPSPLRTLAVNRPETERDKSQWDLAAETVTVRIRWFGLCVGYVLVNFIQRDSGNRLVLNAILTLGALYAIIDTVWSLRGKVFLDRFPLVISFMEAVFIGLLCYF